MGVDPGTYQITDYRKFLLTRISVTDQFIRYLQTIKSYLKERSATKHTFHKIIVHKWMDSPVELFQTLKETFNVAFIPVNYQNLGNICTFYTYKISLIKQMAEMEFMFPFQNSMFSVDVLFNDKSSTELFRQRVPLKEIIDGVICRRFTETYELDLTNFNADPELVENKINFYSLTLLAKFKVTMEKLARDVKILNISKNGLSSTNAEFMNIFTKSRLVGVNLSYNEIKSISMIRITPMIEKLWLEGNPLCDDYTPLNYVKQIHTKFPRLKELDGIPINNHGVPFPLWRNYLPDNDKRVKMLVEKFVMLYFSHYDTSRKNVEEFYADFAKFCLSTSFPSAEEGKLPHYFGHARNAMHLIKKSYVANGSKMYQSRQSIRGVFSSLKPTVHDPTTFTIDVAKFDTGTIMIIIDGVYKEVNEKDGTDILYQFRRTFLLAAVPAEYSETYKVPSTASRYCITNEMLTVSFASEDMKQYSFKNTIRNLNSICLVNPTSDEKQAFAVLFAHCTHLKESAAESFLEKEGWDFLKAKAAFTKAMRGDQISPEDFQESDHNHRAWFKTERAFRHFVRDNVLPRKKDENNQIEYIDLS